MVGFAGWEMPIQYEMGILKEHEAVRTRAGMFDVSHMGRYWVGGPGAHAFIQRLITNDLDRIGADQLLYTPLCLETAGVIDDITVYKMTDGCLVVANASNRAPVWDWFSSRKPAEVILEDWSDRLAQVALQGPLAQEILQPLVAEDLDPIGYYHHADRTLNGAPGVLISRNGYTGEDGFEVYVPAERAVTLWDALRERGAAPIGLGARDTLRMEMTYALYGNELDRETTPLEAGLGWTVKMKKPDFVGKAALEAQKANGLKKSLVGFEASGNRFPRHGQAILSGDSIVGTVTSGGFCPSIKKGMGLGYVRPDLTAVGTKIAIDVRGERVEASVTERPFYKNASHR